MTGRRGDKGTVRFPPAEARAKVPPDRSASNRGWETRLATRPGRAVNPPSLCAPKWFSVLLRAKINTCHQRSTAVLAIRPDHERRQMRVMRGRRTSRRRTQTRRHPFNPSEATTPPRYPRRYPANGSPARCRSIASCPPLLRRRIAGAGTIPTARSVPARPRGQCAATRPRSRHRPRRYPVSVPKCTSQAFLNVIRCSITMAWSQWISFPLNPCDHASAAGSSRNLGDTQS